MTHASMKSLNQCHTTQITDPDAIARLAVEVHSEASDDSYITGFISRGGRVVAWRTAAGEAVMYESAIRVDDSYDWEDIGEPRFYRFAIDERKEIWGDTLRLSLTQSLHNGAASRSAGWRERIVALVPEEVGAKDSKIIRTLADGEIDVTHTYNVLDAYSTYSRWVLELADEFGGTDEKLIAGIKNPDTAPFGSEVNNIVQAWLMREGHEASLQQARHTLKFGLGAFSRLLKMDGYDTGQGKSVSELARSLHTDRPNLTKAIKAAEGNREVKELLTKIDQMG